MTKKDRQSCIQRMFNLHEKKKYKIEAIFTAVAIFDRYLMIVGHWNISLEKQVQLCVICMILAGKLDQPIQPCYDRMTQYLTAAEQKMTSFETLVDMELDVLVRFGFDFNFLGPTLFIERYLRILEQHKVSEVRQLSQQICKYQLCDQMFLNYRPSQIAAAAVIIAMNVN